MASCIRRVAKEEIRVLIKKQYLENLKDVESAKETWTTWGWNEYIHAKDKINKRDISITIEHARTTERKTNIKMVYKVLFSRNLQVPLYKKLLFNIMTSASFPTSIKKKGLQCRPCF